MNPEYLQFIDHPDGAELIYEKALEYSKILPPEKIFMEIGCWKGGTTMALMQAVKDSGVDRWVFSVDPYGSKPFKLGMGTQEEADYNEEIYRAAMLNFSKTANKLKVKHCHWRMMSEDFMKTFPKVEFFDKGKVIKPDFGFVYIDGDHNCYTVQGELEWLRGRMNSGMIVMDDVPYIDMEDQPLIKQALAEGSQDNFRCYWEIK